MSRYTGPRLRKCRRLNTKLPGLTRKSHEERSFPPGQHGTSRRRRPSEFAYQLIEKQKLRFNYGLRERQLKRLAETAKRKSGIAGENLLQLLERRLDNIVFRAGFSPTIPAARQLVTHGHVRVNGKRLDIPSYSVRAGDEISFRAKPGIVALIEESLHRPSLPEVDWLTVNATAKTAVVTELPPATAIPFEVDVQLVIEFYSR